MAAGIMNSALTSGLRKAQQLAREERRQAVRQTVRSTAAAYSSAPEKRRQEAGPITAAKQENTPARTQSGGHKEAYLSLPTGQKAAYARELLSHYRSGKERSGDLEKQPGKTKAVSGRGSTLHISASGNRYGGSHGSFGERSAYEQRRQQRDEARADLWNHTWDLLGTAATQAGRGITGISVPVEQQIGEAQRQIENISAIKESRKQLQQLRELGYVPPRYEDLTTAQKAVDRLLGDRTQITGEKTNWGKLLQGALYKGSDQAVTSIANAADMLFGGLSEELHTLGVESINAALDMANVIPGVDLDYVEPLKEGSALRWSAQKLRDLQQQNQAYFAPNANSSRAAQIVDRFGTGFVAALPMALEAFFLAPAAAEQGMTTQSLNYLSGVSRASGLNALGQMGTEGSRKLLSDPQFWTSYVHAAGDSYQNALEDGISEDDAALYALINGYYNALIEIGGADDALGGVNRLPGRLQNIVQRGNESVAVQWLKSILGEMDEEIGQGIIGRGLKAFAGKSVPLVSFDPEDHDAIFNPYSALEEGVGGGVNAFLLGSLQAGAALAGQSVSQPRNAPTQQAVYSANEAEYLNLLERKGLLPPEGSKNAAPDGTAESLTKRSVRASNSNQDSGIRVGMTEADRYEMLKDRTIRVVADTKSPAEKESLDRLNLIPRAAAQAKEVLIPLAERLGILNRNMKTPEVNIAFRFSKGKGLKESTQKQLRYGGDYVDFAKALINIDEILENAVLIEKHEDKYKGTVRADQTLENVSVLFGAFHDGNFILPVQFEIKKSSAYGGKLYMYVTLTKIEADVLERASNLAATDPSLVSASEYRLTDLFRKVNPRDKHFLKYLPDEMLTDLQKDAKEDALEEDRKRIASYTGNGSRNRSRRLRVARGR